MIKALWTERGDDYQHKEFKKYCMTVGIHHIVTPPYSPWQDGLTE